jgi:hypothetical protein
MSLLNGSCALSENDIDFVATHRIQPNIPIGVAFWQEQPFNGRQTPMSFQM